MRWRVLLALVGEVSAQQGEALLRALEADGDVKARAAGYEGLDLRMIQLDVVADAEEEASLIARDKLSVAAASTGWPGRFEIRRVERLPPPA